MQVSWFLDSILELYKVLKSVDETQYTLILVFRLHILTELSKETSIKCIQTGDYPSLNRGNVVYVTQ